MNACAWTDGLEEDRYALQSSSLASPMRSPQRYSPSVHLHQVKLLFNVCLFSFFFTVFNEVYKVLFVSYESYFVFGYFCV